MKWVADILRGFEPRVKPPLGDWLEAHVLMPPDKGPWASWAYPHLHAPGGPIEAYGDPDVRTIWLQFASRLGKTAFGHGALLYQAAVDPCPMLFGSATEKLVHRSVVTKLYPMIELCDPLRDQLRPKSRRQNTLVELRHCRIFAAWSGSSSHLADISARVSHANEIDKWTSFNNSEADPLKLFDERSKEHPQHKRVKESTPTIKGKSRIERGIAGSDNRSLWCKCPLCGTYQILDFGFKGSKFGVKWTPGSNPEQAKRSAAYVCCGCEGRIEEQRRPAFIRSGVWLPEGQTIEGENVVGDPVRPGSEVGFRLSSLYALSLGWGDIAAEFLRSKDSAEDLKNFHNSWLGNTWEEYRSETNEEQLAARLCVPRRAGVVSDNSLFLTLGVDVQQDHLVYVVVGWGLNTVGSVVRWGTVREPGDLTREVLEAFFVDESKTWKHRIARGLIDAGYSTDQVYAYIRSRFAAGDNRLIPSKGAATHQPEGFKLLQDSGSLPRVLINTTHWQVVVQRAFEHLLPGDPGSLDLPAEARTDPDFLSQLLNEMPEKRTDRNNYGKEIWVLRNAKLPNDFRDALRYARVAAEMVVGSAWARLHEGFRTRFATRLGSATVVDPAAPIQPQPVQRPAAKPQGFRMPDGRPFLITERRR